ncbi:E3 ubiquitin-protein transferase RMND5B isoform 1-T1 [Neosynchiropus ocellatus]
MEQCACVERELEKVLHRFVMYGHQSEERLDELLHSVCEIRGQLVAFGVQDADLSVLSQTMAQCCKNIKETVQMLASQHKDIHGSVSKVGKAIDRNFDAEISAVVAETVWDTPERQKHLSETIVEHLYRQGMLSVAEDLCQESGVVIDMSMKQPFLELNRILEALRMQDLRPALEWAVTNRQRLLDLNSTLEFKLHRLYFISLLSGGIGNQMQALQYARHFQPFASQHQRGKKRDDVTVRSNPLSMNDASVVELKPVVVVSADIQILMGSLVYLRHGIENSPYRSLLETNQWAEICNIFTRDACALLGLSVESPLSVSFASGCMALPVLMNIKQVIEQRQCSGVWTHKDELPIEIDLGKKCWYHSVFACPILRQQTSESNPPMKLICGHVISRDALNKLTNAGKLKCPYCPMEQNPSHAKQIYF